MLFPRLMVTAWLKARVPKIIDSLVQPRQPGRSRKIPFTLLPKDRAPEHKCNGCPSNWVIMPKKARMRSADRSRKRFKHRSDRLSGASEL